MKKINKNTCTAMPCKHSLSQACSGNSLDDPNAMLVTTNREVVLCPARNLRSAYDHSRVGRCTCARRPDPTARRDKAYLRRPCAAQVGYLGRHPQGNIVPSSTSQRWRVETKTTFNGCERVRHPSTVLFPFCPRTNSWRSLTPLEMASGWSTCCLLTGTAISVFRTRAGNGSV